MMFPAPVDAPPMVLVEAESIRIPSALFATLCVALKFVPIRFPLTVLPVVVEPKKAIPFWALPEMTFPAPAAPIRVISGVLNENAVLGVADAAHPGAVGADEVVQDDVAARGAGGAPDEDAAEAVARDDVARADPAAADHVIGSRQRYSLRKTDSEWRW